MVALAPQLTHGFVGARPGQPFPKHLLDAITDVEVVDEFDGYPDKWLGKSRGHLRARRPAAVPRQAAVRRGGPDAEGRASMIQVRSSHALLEGSDSALLTRSQSARARRHVGKANKVGLGRPHHAASLQAQLLAWTYIVLANLLAPPTRSPGASRRSPSSATACACSPTGSACASARSISRSSPTRSTARARTST